MDIMYVGICQYYLNLGFPSFPASSGAPSSSSECPLASITFKVFIPKLAEDALYAYMLYNLSKLRPVSAQLAPLYKKEASAKMRNTKIRLSNYNLKELAQVLRGKAKWIKH